MPPLPWTLSPYAYPLLLTSPLLVVVMVYSWRHRRVPGAWAMFGLAGAALIYSLAYVGELGSRIVPQMIAWIRVEYIGAKFLAVFVLAFVLAYTGRGKYVTPLNTLLVSIVPALTVLVAWTTPPGDLLWKNPYPIFAGQQVFFGFTPGPYYLFDAVYTWLLVLVGLLVLARSMVRARGQFRAQYVFVFVTLSIPLLAYLAYSLQIGATGIDINPYAHGLTVVILSWGVYAFRLFDLRPLAREAVMASLSDAVLVLDGQGRLVDFNPTAQQILCVKQKAIGQPILDVLIDCPQLRRFIEETVASAELETLINGEPRHMLARRSAIRGQDAGANGEVLLLTDITERVRNQRDIAHLNRELSWMVTHDQLTGLYNRRFLEDHFRALITAPGVHDLPVAVILADLDRFKRVNDSFGHAAGDEVLRTVGDCLRQSLRHNDIACRYGGEEFVIILPGAGAAVAAMRAEQFRAAIGALQTRWEGETLVVTASFGVALFPTHGDALETVIHAADVALYAAKNDGRNRTRVASLPEVVD